MEELTDEMFDEWFNETYKEEEDYPSLEHRDAFKRYVRVALELKWNDRIRQDRRLCTLCNHVNSPHEFQLNNQNIGYYCEECHFTCFMIKNRL